MFDATMILKNTHKVEKKSERTNEPAKQIKNVEKRWNAITKKIGLVQCKVELTVIRLCGTVFV